MLSLRETILKGLSALRARNAFRKLILILNPMIKKSPTIVYFSIETTGYTASERGVSPGRRQPGCNRLRRHHAPREAGTRNFLPSHYARTARRRPPRNTKEARRWRRDGRLQSGRLAAFGCGRRPAAQPYCAAVCVPPDQQRLHQRVHDVIAAAVHALLEEARNRGDERGRRCLRTGGDRARGWRQRTGVCQEEKVLQ